MNEHWLTPEEAATYLGLPSRAAVYAAVSRRELPHYRWGRRIRFRVSELDRTLERGQRGVVENFSDRDPSCGILDDGGACLPGKEDKR